MSGCVHIADVLSWRLLSDRHIIHQEAGIDVRLGELAGYIQETMESYEVEVNGKTFPGQYEYVAALLGVLTDNVIAHQSSQSTVSVGTQLYLTRFTGASLANQCALSRTMTLRRWRRENTSPSRLLALQGAGGLLSRANVRIIHAPSTYHRSI